MKVMPAPVREYYSYTSKQRSLQRSQDNLPFWERREGEEEKPVVRVGFIGAGDYAQHHLKVLSALRNVQLASILTTGGPRVQEAASKYGIQRLFTDRGAFLAQDDVDCFVVVVPAGVIHSVASEALGTGKPVLLEKPPGVSPEQTAGLVEQARAHNTYGMVCMNRRFYSVLEHGLAALATYGPIRGATLEVPEQISAERQSQRLTEWDYDHFAFRNSVHAIDLLRYVLGDVAEVHSIARPNALYKNAAASFGGVIEHDTGALSTVLALWDANRSWRLTVIGEHGRLVLEPFEQAQLLTERGLPIPIKPDPIDQDFRAGVYAQDLTFIESVRRQRKPGLPACLLPDAYQTNQLIAKLYQG